MMTEGNATTSPAGKCDGCGATDVPLMKIIWGTVPYVLCMFLAIVILCVFPEIATWLPDTLMGPVRTR